MYNGFVNYDRFARNIGADGYVGAPAGWAYQAAWQGAGSENMPAGHPDGLVPVIHPDNNKHGGIAAFPEDPYTRAHRHFYRGKKPKRRLVVKRKSKSKPEWSKLSKDDKDALKTHAGALVQEVKKAVKKLDDEFNKNVWKPLYTGWGRRRRRDYSTEQPDSEPFPPAQMYQLWEEIKALIEDFSGQETKLGEAWVRAYETEVKRKKPADNLSQLTYHLPEPPEIKREFPDYSDRYVSVTVHGDRFSFIGPDHDLDTSSIGALSRSAEKPKFGSVHNALAASINRSHKTHGNKMVELFHAIGDGNAFVRVYCHAKSSLLCKKDEVDKTDMKVDCDLTGYVKAEEHNAFKKWLANPLDPVRFFVFGAKGKGQEGTYCAITMNNDTRFRLPHKMLDKLDSMIKKDHHDGILRFKHDKVPEWVGLGLGQTWIASFGNGIIEHDFTWHTTADAGAAKEHKAYGDLAKILEDQPPLQAGQYDPKTRKRSMHKFDNLDHKYSNRGSMMALALDPLSSVRFYLLYKIGGIAMQHTIRPPNAPECAFNFYALLNFGWTVEGDIGLVKRASKDNHLKKPLQIDENTRLTDTTKEMLERSQGHRPKLHKEPPPEVGFGDFLGAKEELLSKIG